MNKRINNLQHKFKKWFETDQALRDKSPAWLNSKSALVVSLLFTLLWQSYYYQNSDGITNEVQRKYTTGFAYNLGQNFVYFYYYLGLFPVFSSEEPVYSAEGARKILNEKGETLFMECEHWARLGENARIFAFLPNAYIDGGPMMPSIKLFNAIFFIAGLMSVLIGFYLQGKLLLALLLVLITGASPFYLYETYGNENIFGLATSIAYILLGLMIAAVFSKKRQWDWLVAPFCGILVAFACNIRAEILPVIAAPLLIYAFHRKYGWPRKLVLMVLVVFAYMSVNRFIVSYFGLLFEEAYEVVSEKGGHPYDGDKIISHGFWHPVFCGLGDYDKDHGYTEWKDSIAYRYAIPILKEKYNMDLNYSGNFYLDEYYDEEGHYYKKFDEIPEYDKVIKDKVLSDIKNDPLWYIDILFKRFNKVMNNTSPIGFGNYYLKMRGVGWLLIPLIMLLIFIREWTYVKLLTFTLPLVATPIIIYSGGNSTYNSPYHLIMLALLISILIERFIIFSASKNRQSYD